MVPKLWYKDVDHINGFKDITTIVCWNDIWTQRKLSSDFGRVLLCDCVFGITYKLTFCVTDIEKKPTKTKTSKGNWVIRIGIQWDDYICEWWPHSIPIAFINLHRFLFGISMDFKKRLREW